VPQLNFNTVGKVNFPLRILRGGNSKLYFPGGKTESPMVFGNVYRGVYRNPITKRGPKKVVAQKLPLHDLTPLFIFLEYQPPTKTILGLNLHFTLPSDGKEMGGGIRVNPNGVREIMMTLVNMIKRRLNIIGGLEDLGEDFFTENNIDYEAIAREELQLTNEQEALIDKIIEDTASSQRGFNWGALMKIRNRYFNVLNICFRRYSIQRLAKCEDIDLYKLSERKEMLSDESPQIRLITPSGERAWTTKDTRQLNMEALRFKDWYQLIRKKQGLPNRYDA
jgi:hypothetical protein